MKKLQNFKCLLYVILLTHLFSCKEDDILGEWHLKSIESICPNGDMIEVINTFEMDGMCCVRTLTTQNFDSYTQTSTNTSCEAMIFKSDGIVDFYIDDFDKPGISATYVLDGDKLEICYAFGECIKMRFKGDEIIFEIESISIGGLPTCENSYLYRR